MLLNKKVFRCDKILVHKKCKTKNRTDSQIPTRSLNA